MPAHKKRFPMAVALLLLLMLCGLALVRSADIRTGCDAGAEAVLPEQNAYENWPVSETAEAGSSAEHVFSSDVLSDGEAQQLQADCREIAACYQDLYQQAEKVPSITMAGEEILLQGDIDRIEDRLAALGYAVLNTDSRYPAFLEHSQGLRQFWQMVQQGGSGRQDIIWISADGGFTFCRFETSPQENRIVEAVVQWKDGQTAAITELYAQQILDWELTDQGSFYYQTRVFSSPTFENYVLIRLNRPDQTLWDLNAAYVEPVGYQGNNLFLCDWSHADYGALSFNDLLEPLYQLQHGYPLAADTFPLQRQSGCREVPAALFEQTILPYFDVSLGTFRQKSRYDAQSSIYPWAESENGSRTEYPTLLPEVVAYRNNPDGTLTLTVQAMCVTWKTDCLFSHAVTIDTDPDGSFRYLGNQILSRSDRYPMPDGRARLDDA